MPLSAGTATSGKTGALATKSLATGGIQRFLPVGGFNPTTSRGDALIPLINNAAYAANKIVGLTMAQFSFAFPLIPSIMPADFFTRAIVSVSGDTDIANYHTLTMYPDNAGSSPDVYALCKYGSLSGQVAFSANGAAQAAGLSMTGMSIDPYSGSVAALTAPSAGAISTGGAKGFAQTAITGATQVVGVSFDVSTGLTPTPGVQAGTNANFPYIGKGLLLTNLGGIVSITQFKNAATILGTNGTDGTMDLAFGTTGDGLGITFKLMPLVLAAPSSQNINFITSRYALKSIDGTTSPIVFRDL